jgi:hypothetical protein
MTKRSRSWDKEDSDELHEVMPFTKRKQRLQGFEFCVEGETEWFPILDTLVKKKLTALVTDPDVTKVSYTVNDVVYTSQQEGDMIVETSDRDGSAYYIRPVKQMNKESTDAKKNKDMEYIQYRKTKGRGKASFVDIWKSTATGKRYAQFSLHDEPHIHFVLDMSSKLSVALQIGNLELAIMMNQIRKQQGSNIQFVVPERNRFDPTGSLNALVGPLSREDTNIDIASGPIPATDSGPIPATAYGPIPATSHNLCASSITTTTRTLQSRPVEMSIVAISKPVSDTPIGAIIIEDVDEVNFPLRDTESDSLKKIIDACKDVQSALGDIGLNMCVDKVRSDVSAS